MVEGKVWRCELECRDAKQSVEVRSKVLEAEFGDSQFEPYS
jgi:hypothetical protein